MIYFFSEWDKLKEDVKNNFVYLFLDCDGTLAPIVKTPDKAVISKDTKELLCELSKNSKCKIAVISGRALNDVKHLLGLKGIIYIGNHGLEIEGPKLKFKSVVPAGFKGILKRIKFDLSKKLASFKGALLEDKGYTLSLHYRLVNEKQIPSVKTAFHEVIATYLVSNKIKIKPGKMVLEIKPPLEWDKGKAVLWLLARSRPFLRKSGTRQKFALKDKDVFPIYIGDDVTDEDAFKALKNKGVTIFVGKPKKSNARYYLKGPKEVEEFLRRVLETQKTQPCPN